MADYADIDLNKWGVERTPDNKDSELQATRFNFAKYQLQRKNHFQVQFLPSRYDPTLSIDPELRFMLKSFPLPKKLLKLMISTTLTKQLKLLVKLHSIISLWC